LLSRLERHFYFVAHCDS